MKVVIQRVLSASVTIDNSIIRKMGPGLVILVGIEVSDNNEDVNWLSAKIVKLRIFDDDEGVMNKNVLEVNGQLMLISQFTLHASTKKGNRPSYSRAAGREIAIPLYQYFIEKLKKESLKEVVTGEFGADMKVELINDGPVTIIMASVKSIPVWFAIQIKTKITSASSSAKDSPDSPSLADCSP